MPDDAAQLGDAVPVDGHHRLIDVLGIHSIEYPATHKTSTDGGAIGAARAPAPTQSEFSSGPLTPQATTFVSDAFNAQGRGFGQQAFLHRFDEFWASKLRRGTGCGRGRGGARTQLGRGRTGWRRSSGGPGADSVPHGRCEPASEAARVHRADLTGEFLAAAKHDQGRDAADLESRRGEPV